MKKILMMLMIISMIFTSSISAFAISYDELPSWTTVGDTETVTNEYSYDEVKALKLKLKSAKDSIANKIANGVTDVGTAVGIIEKVFSDKHEIQIISTTGNYILVASALLWLDRGIGIQRIYSDIEDDYEYYNDILDEMNTNDDVTIKQKFEFKKIKILGDYFFGWYPKGSRTYTIY
ncbi:hypothetical protein [Wukongibacter sp. M2B1]|uniref:hypothetical protein n=1 Tax=Wukongibacter sp. M2B1 TaxID=3088895 RepID=UPI003D7A33B9